MSEFGSTTSSRQPFARQARSAGTRRRRWPSARSCRRATTARASAPANWPTGAISSDSVTSNFAKGYLSAQLMTLVIANQRLIVQKEQEVEDPWLLQALAYLASAYYAGNDYTGRYLAQYLTSRPAVISLTQPLDEH